MSSAVRQAGSRYQVVTRRVPLASQQETDFVDITDVVNGVVRASGVCDGIVVVFTTHTTAGIVINEAEPLLLDDLRRRLEQFAPRAARYDHDDLSVRTVNVEPNERMNGHAHCQRLMIGASETIPVADGVMLLGRWQRIFFLDLDGPRPREVLIQIQGV
ncbi:MAG: YjbQ family protein [Chloroflexi bacterium]|nr:YjbQ family protein [Chloroflexota bacterium]